MCRMMAIMSKRRISSSFLHDFRLLAEKGDVLPIAKEPGHKDGWGLVCYQEHHPLTLDRQPTDAMSDSRYEEACDYLDKLPVRGILLAHLRKASEEYRDVCLENTAPFVRDDWCFAHNGTIRRFKEEVKGLKGTTDSERFFLILLEEMEENKLSIESAIAKTVHKVRESYRYSSMTFLLSNGTRIYAYREYLDPKYSWYYNLMYAVDKNMVLVSQQKIWYRDWVTIPNRTLVTIFKNLKVCSRNI